MWSGLLRNPVRTGLTLLTIIIAFALFGLLRGFTDGFSALADNSYTNVLQMVPKYNTGQGLPIAYLPRLKETEGIATVSYASGLGGYYQHPDQQVYANAVPADGSWFEALENTVLGEGALAGFQASRTAAIVGIDLLTETKLSIGDRMPLVVGNDTIAFDIVGSYDFKEEEWIARSLMIRYDYFDEARPTGKGTVFVYLMTAKDGVDPSALARQIDDSFANAPVSTRTSSQRDNVNNVLNQITGLHNFINGVVFTAFLTILIVTGGTMLQSMRERIPEFAVMKAFGYSGHIITGIAFAESILLCVIGAIIGLGGAQLAMPHLQPNVTSVTLIIPPSIVGASLLIAVVFGCVAAAFPSIHVQRSSVIDALAGR